jgi:hypothetical protein
MKRDFFGGNILRLQRVVVPIVREKNAIIVQATQFRLFKANKANP